MRFVHFIDDRLVQQKQPLARSFSQRDPLKIAPAHLRGAETVLVEFFTLRTLAARISVFLPQRHDVITLVELLTQAANQ